MPTTTNRQYPYPTLDDSLNEPSQVQAMAQAIDADVAQNVIPYVGAQAAVTPTAGLTNLWTQTGNAQKLGKWVFVNLTWQRKTSVWSAVSDGSWPAAGIAQLATGMRPAAVIGPFGGAATNGTEVHFRVNTDGTIDARDVGSTDLPVGNFISCVVSFPVP